MTDDYTSDHEAAEDRAREIAGRMEQGQRQATEMTREGRAHPDREQVTTERTVESGDTTVRTETTQEVERGESKGEGDS